MIEIPFLLSSFLHLDHFFYYKNRSFKRNIEYVRKSPLVACPKESILCPGGQPVSVFPMTARRSSGKGWVGRYCVRLGEEEEVTDSAQGGNHQNRGQLPSETYCHVQGPGESQEVVLVSVYPG